ncbi:hypothetical protein A3Y22_22475 [Salmonella enterica subsp. enterica serovar Reading]|nr:hypothetical protein [Salmonella enterica subsp. enterica serovar Reading]ECU6113997.1 hypothetical protein [Salmonella enterica subsp. enterica serovar Reading]
MIAKRIENERKTSSIAKLAKYIVNAKGGLDPRSWERTADYILDANNEANSQGEKVGGVRVSNCGTADPAAATILIQTTQAMNVKSTKDKTYHMVFSFPPGEQPPLEVLHAIEDELCATIGYADHQRISAVHIDTDHLHVHVAINKVHPTGHQNIEPYYDKKRLMAACERLEVKYGLERTNHGLGENQYEQRYDRSNGRAAGRIQLGPEQRPGERDSLFRAYLRKSHNLKTGKRPEAQTLNGLRNLSGCNMAHLSERGTLLLPNNARHGLEQHGEKPIDGLRWAGNGNRTDAGRSDGIGATVSTIEAQSGIETLASYVSKNVATAINEAKSWQGVHDALAEHGLEIKPRGAGFVIGDAGLPLWVRASQCGRDLAFKAMTERLGPYEAQQGQNEGKGRKARYTPKPVHQHASTAQLFAQYQREKQANLAARKSGFERLKKENATYLAELRHWSAQQRALLKVSGRGVTRRTMSVTIKNQTAAAREKHKKSIQQKREQLYKSTVMPSWADWLARQAEQGNPDALDVLRSRAEREEKLRGDLLTAKNADRAKAVLLKALKPATRRDGTVSYRTADGGMVIDRKSHVQAQKATTGAALIALTLAAEKFDGQPLIVEGTDQFKKEVAQLAAMHRLNVVFADPVMEQAKQQAAIAREAEQPKPAQRNQSRVDKAPKEESRAASATTEPPKSVTDWIEKRNKSRDKISSIDYHRVWQQTDAGRATYQGRRKMEDGTEVLLLKRGDEMLVKPAGPRVVAKASKFKVGQPVVLDARGRFVNTSRAMER